MSNTTEPREVASSESAEAEHLEQTRVRAYELFCQRGGEHGRHFDDWLEAERELRQESIVSRSDGRENGNSAA